MSYQCITHGWSHLQNQCPHCMTAIRPATSDVSLLVNKGITHCLSGHQWISPPVVCPFCERDRLKEENEKLKSNQLFEASCTSLFEENLKLKERVVKLRDALNEISDNESIEVIDEIITEALAADDEMEGK